MLVHGGAGKTPDFLVEPKFVGMKVKHQLKHSLVTLASITSKRDKVRHRGIGDESRARAL